MAGAESALSLDVYKVQLQQVNEALRRENDESSIKDLKQLRDDLIQLISLTDENFQDEISVSTETGTRKSSQHEEIPASSIQEKEGDKFADELSDFYSDIARIEDPVEKLISSDRNENNLGDGLGNSYSEINDFPVDTSKDLKQEESDVSKSHPSNTANDKFLDSIENLEDISGFKCQAPFSTEWAGLQYHNAMIKGLVDKEMADEDDDIRVKVLFLNPTMKTMQPCPYYLDGNCKFDASQCRYSHGHVVSLYDLQPYVTPDYTNLEEGCKCIAKMEDGLWKPGIVDKIEDNFYHIKFLHKDVNLLLELCHILPQIDHAEEEDRLSDYGDEVVTEIIPSSNVYSKYGESSSTSSDKPNIGLWEEHTKGIGLKLLQKMGYKLGDGLGKLSQGRLEPVPIVVLPPGKSLDHCMKIREEKGVKKINDGVQSLEKGRVDRKKHKHCVFSFLNKTLGDKTKNRPKKEVLKTKDMFGIKEGKDKKATKNFNKEMFKNDEEMKRIKGKIQKLQESLRRNQGNPSVTKSLRSKLEELKKQLRDMKEYDSNIKMHRSRAETHRKMTVF